jgi:hypothetical protein
MADNIKISDLTELTSGSLRDATIFPVVDGGTTKKASLSSLQSYLTDDLATDAELSTQISNVNSSISSLTSTVNNLDTGDITEGSNLYYTDARVKTKLNAESVISSSLQIDIKDSLNANTVVSSSQQISASAAAAGFGSGEGGGSLPNGTVSSSAQTIAHLGGSDIISGSLTSDDITDFDDAVSASAALAGFGAGDGGGEGGSTDYISNVAFSGTTLTFTGTGNAFNSTVDLSGENLATTDDIVGFLAVSTYNVDSSSFASRLDSGGGGGGSVPDGTVSSSAQTILHLGGTGVLSSSAQIDVTGFNVANMDLTSLTADDISEGATNKYYTNSNVLSYINSLGVVSGSVIADTNLGGTGVVSSSTQIIDLGFPTNAEFNAATQSLQTQINDINAGVSVADVNTFLAEQFFTENVTITGSLIVHEGTISGSGANLFDIPASSIVGGLQLSGSSIADGNNSVVVSYNSGVVATVNTGSFSVNNGNLIVSGGVFSGSGAGLTNIPGDAIQGGVDGQKIFSSSFSASIADNGDFIVNTNAIFESNIYSSGSVTAESISVGTSGTPTIYSNNNLNLSASNAVVVTDSPLRLNPMTNEQTSSFTLSAGDIIYSSTEQDFLGYKLVNDTGSWSSLTIANVAQIDWDYVNGKPQGLISSSTQIGDLGGGLVSSSTQLTPSGAVAGTIYFEDTLDNITGSSDFTYTVGTRTLNVNKLIANEIVANTSLSEPGNSTGSFGRVETDRLNINGAIEFPFSDGTANDMIITDGAGNLSFSSITSLIDSQTITTTGNVTMGTGSVNTDFTVDGTLNIGSPVTSTINNLSATIESQTISLQASGSLILSASGQVTIEDVLVLEPRTTNPANPQSGSIIASGSGATIKPYFWDGNQWNALY